MYKITINATSALTFYPYGEIDATGRSVEWLMSELYWRSMIQSNRCILFSKRVTFLMILILCGQPAYAQNFLGQLLGIEPSVSREAAEQAELFPEEGEPEPEPSLAELINAEVSEYPTLVSSIDYVSRTECILALSEIYDASLNDGIYAISRMDFWLDRYIEPGREIYICDGAILNAYYDDDNEVPVRWRMVRTSVDIILSQLDTQN